MPGAWGAASRHTSLQMPSFPRTNMALTEIECLRGSIGCYIGIPPCCPLPNNGRLFILLLLLYLGGYNEAHTQSHTRTGNPWRFPDVRFAFFFFFRGVVSFCSGGGVGTGCREPA